MGDGKCCRHTMRTSGRTTVASATRKMARRCPCCSPCLPLVTWLVGLHVTLQKLVTSVSLMDGLIMS